MTERTVHIPVMRDEVLAALNAQDGGSFVDCTLGGAGHTEAILDAHATNTVFALDRDQRAIERAKERLSRFNGRVKFHHSEFGLVGSVTDGNSFDGMLVDLGLSTDQLKENRGFSFHDAASLDMRMDESQEFSAESVVNQYTDKKLLTALKRGGVGREASVVTRAIMQARPIKTTGELSKIINKAAAGFTAKKKINPSTVIFQAIRMEVNGELLEIEAMLNAAPGIVRTGGRLAIITFHSIEDRLVTNRMRQWEQGDSAPATWRGPRVPSKGKQVSNKPIVAGEDEVQRNLASRSARLRVFEFGN